MFLITTKSRLHPRSRQWSSATARLSCNSCRAHSPPTPGGLIHFRKHSISVPKTARPVWRRKWPAPRTKSRLENMFLPARQPLHRHLRRLGVPRVANSRPLATKLQPAYGTGGEQRPVPMEKVPPSPPLRSFGDRGQPKLPVQKLPVHCFSSGHGFSSSPRIVESRGCRKWTRAQWTRAQLPPSPPARDQERDNS